jgi:tRNA(Arg) A34 adenosine deaminase TadA
MCSGAAILFGIKRVVIGENVNFVGTFFPLAYIVPSFISIKEEKIY